MKIRRTLVAMALLAVTSVAFADTMLVKKIHQDAMPMMNQPATESTQTTWIGSGKLRIDGGDTGFIVRADQKKMFMLNANGKKAYAIDLPIDVSKLVTAEQQPLIEQMKAMQMKVTVTPSAETKKFGQLTAKRYDVVMENTMGMKNQQVIWASTDAKVDVAALLELMAPLMKLNPAMTTLAEEMKKVEGVALASETTVSMMGNTFKITEEFVSLEEKAAPAGTYDLPEGYTVEPFNLINSMTQGRP